MHFMLDRRRVYGENALKGFLSAVNAAEILFRYLIWRVLGMLLAAILNPKGNWYVRIQLETQYFE